MENRKPRTEPRYCKQCGKLLANSDRHNLCSVCRPSHKNTKRGICPKCGGPMKKGSKRCAKCISSQHIAHSFLVPAINKAHSIIGKRVRGGKLVHGICKWPGCSQKGVEFHHPDYSKPEYVIDLCRKHHWEIHHGGALAVSEFGKSSIVLA